MMGMKDFCKELVMSARREQFVVDERGKRRSVILSVSHYQRMLEDLHDLAVVAERRNEAPISLAEMKRRLRNHGRPPKPRDE